MGFKHKYQVFMRIIIMKKVKIWMIWILISISKKKVWQIKILIEIANSNLKYDKINNQTIIKI